jgi:hypothetical protein
LYKKALDDRGDARNLLRKSRSVDTLHTEKNFDVRKGVSEVSRSQKGNCPFLKLRVERVLQGRKSSFKESKSPTMVTEFLMQRSRPSL